jgi:lambda family phage portal protein
MNRKRHNAEAQSIVEQFDGLRSDYDAARQTRFKRKRVGIQTGGSHADYHYRTWSAYAGMMETSRDLFRNHCLIGQGIRRLVSNVLLGGFTLDTKTGDAALDDELSARWYEWAEDPEQCDRAGEQSFNDMERLALQHVIVDGDVSVLPTVEGSLQFMEAHRLRTPTNTKKNVVHGVLLDGFRRRQQYWFTKEDVAATAALALVNQTEQIDARAFDELTGREERQVYHLYMPDRVSQTRGLTALVPVVDTAGMGDDLMFATLVKAQMGACITILRTLEGSVTTPPAMGEGAGEDVTVEARPNGSTRQLIGWQPGTEIFGFPGEKIQGFSPNVPNAEFFDHAALILTMLALNLDLPLCVFTLDASNTNFSGFRGSIDQARQRFQQRQQWLIRSFHCPVYRWKVRQWAREDGAIRRALEATVAKKKVGADGVDVFGHVWHAQEWPYIEPIQDAMGDVVQDRNLQLSARRIAARRGLDYDDNLQEMAEDRGKLIDTFQQAADQQNEKHGTKPGWKTLIWSDIAHWPMPEGVQIAVGAQPAQEQKSEPAKEKANGTPVNRIASLEKVNGHAN